MFTKKFLFGDFPGGPVAQTPCSQCKRAGLDPWSGSYNPHCCRKGEPFQGSKLGSCLTFRNELSEETQVMTIQETLLGRGAWVECSRVREPKKTALPCGSQPSVFIIMRLVSGLSLTNHFHFNLGPFQMTSTSFSQDGF